MSMFSSHAALLTKTGAVYTWGNAASGRLGHSSGTSPLSRTDTFASDEQAEMKNDDTRVLPERVSVVPNPTLVCGLLESVCVGVRYLSFGLVREKHWRRRKHAALAT